MQQILARDLTKTWSGLPAPQDWHVIDTRGDGLAWERMVGSRLYVVEDICVKEDGRHWLHVSISKHNGKMPNWDDIQTMRTLFVGEDRECYMIFPPKERYVNIHSACLHLWSCLDAESGVLPQFDGVVDGVRTI